MGALSIRKIASLFTLILLLGINASFAQQRTISGTVTDGTTGETLPGASVKVKGTSRGATTDLDGNFKVEATANDVLVVSFIGYATQEIEVGNKTSFDIQMGLDVSQLSEVVVVGYGTQEEEDVTGVVTTVDEKQFNKGIISSPDNLISGKVAGVVVSPSSELGGQSSIRIRGASSINASSDPLIVVDGVPIDNNGYSGGRNGLNFINPSDIESVTVLKDASATAIYGSRAANGVIIYTTKSGKSGEMKVQYNGNYSISQFYGDNQFLSPSNFRATVQNRAPQRTDFLGEESTDWPSEVLQTATSQNHEVSVSGGGENLRFYSSVSYMQNRGVLRTAENDIVRTSIKLNSSLLDDHLKITFVNKNALTNDVFAPNVLAGAYGFDPTQPVRADGYEEYGGYFEWREDNAARNPVSILEQTNDYGKTFRSFGNIDLQYTLPFFEKLSIQTVAGWDVNSGRNEVFRPTTLYNSSQDGYISLNRSIRQNFLSDTYLTYKEEIESINSNIEVLVGYSYQEFYRDQAGYFGFDLESDIFGVNDPAQAETLNAIGPNAITNKLESFFGRVNFKVQDKYLFTANVRRDGSTRFGENNRYGIFPSAALGWRVLEEDFMAGLTDVFSNLKIRAGWGIIGNQDFGDYLYEKTYGYSEPDASYQFGDDYVLLIRPTAVDPDVKWEQTATTNIGLDFGFLNNRLTGSLEFYDKYTKDLLFDANVIASTNVGDRQVTNVGEMSNKGIELSISAVTVDREDFDWNINANLAYNKNEIIRLTNGDEGDAIFETGGISGDIGQNIQVLQAGFPINSFRTFQQIYNADGTPVVGSRLEMYEDINDDGIIDDNDYVVVESPNPDLTFGLTSLMNYKKFDLSFTLRGSIGNYVYNNTASANGNYNRLTEFRLNNIHESVLETNFTSRQLKSDYYLENGSFLRLDNITLGYNIDQLNDFRARVYFTVQNLYTLTGYSGYNPDIQNGIDNNLRPLATNYSLGLNLTF
jgi:iron complex outermembrane receptor protein